MKNCNREFQRQFLEECSICCQYKPRTTSEQDQIRPPEICYDCWYSHISNVVLRMGYKVGDSVLSPFNTGQPIDIITCVNSLQSHHSQQIEETLFKKYNSFTKDIEKCPAENCDYVYVGERCQWRNKDNVYNCPKCDMPLLLNTNYSITKIYTFIYLILSNKCPKCAIPIQRHKGCPHMTCPCGHHFCWYCYKDHPSGNPYPKVYSLHTIPECSFIFLSKIILIILSILSIIVSSQGRGYIDWMTGILGTIFSVVWRALMVDGIILLQIMLYMMMMKKANGFRSTYTNRLILSAVIINLAILLTLYFFDELFFCFCILTGEVMIAIVIFVVGYAIVYSVETWFEFIA